MSDKAYDNNLRGVLFPEKEKRSENSPDYSGSCEIDGKQYWLDGWKRRSQKGDPFLSLRLKPKSTRASVPPTAAIAVPKVPEPPPFDDDIPF